jgi:hypothetical protein
MVQLVIDLRIAGQLFPISQAVLSIRRNDLIIHQLPGCTVCHHTHEVDRLQMLQDRAIPDPAHVVRM